MGRSLSAEYAFIYEQMLGALTWRAPKATEQLTSFWPMCGDNFDGGLMVIGRAVNGWRHRWMPAGIAELTERAAVLCTSRRLSEEPWNPPERPMMWVVRKTGNPQEKYNINRSAFWRVVRAVCERQSASPPLNWPLHLCWSNLHKVSPKAGGNPSKSLREAQLPFALRLIERELVEFAPRRVFVLAGKRWFLPFAKHLKIDIAWSAGHSVEGKGHSAERVWVVAQHPQGKPQNQMDRGIISAFEELAHA